MACANDRHDEVQPGSQLESRDDSRHGFGLDCKTDGNFDVLMSRLCTMYGGVSCDGSGRLQNSGEVDARCLGCSCQQRKREASQGTELETGPQMPSHDLDNDNDNEDVSAPEAPHPSREWS